MKFTHGRKSRIESSDPRSKGFDWFIRHLASDFNQSLEIRHSGRCGYCGRHLTTPESVDTGFGPDCSALLGIAYGKGLASTFDVKRFLTGGKAFLTLTSRKSGVSYTYKVSGCKDNKDLYFVSVLNGPDNWENYLYIGVLTTAVQPAKLVAKAKEVGPKLETGIFN